MNYVTDHDITQFFVTETWITEINNHTTATVKSFGYSIHHCFRSNTMGGGVAIIFKSTMKVVKMFIRHPGSFESVSVKLKCYDGINLFCSCLYRTGNLGNFINDFDQFLGDIFLRFERFLLCGDINIHLDEDNAQTRAFNDTIASYGLYQLVTESTHKDGHLLDIVVASHKVVTNNIISINNQSQKDFPACDHFPLHYELEYHTNSNDSKKKIMFRNLKNIDADIFSLDLDLALKESRRH